MSSSTGITPGDGHDGIYKAFFDRVGCNPSETPDKLLQQLPHLKQSDLETQVEPPTGPKLPIFIAPEVDPLLREWELAADEEDLPIEEGDWVDVAQLLNPQSKAEEEEVDEQGVAVVKLQRASSGFILDGPGSVQVDNFCLDVDTTETPSPTNHTDFDVGSSYVPSLVEKAAASTQLPSSTEQKAVKPLDVPSAGAADAKIVTLEDEIKALRLKKDVIEAEEPQTGSASASKAADAAEEEFEDLPASALQLHSSFPAASSSAPDSNIQLLPGECHNDSADFIAWQQMTGGSGETHNCPEPADHASDMEGVGGVLNTEVQQEGPSEEIEEINCIASATQPLAGVFEDLLVEDVESEEPLPQAEQAAAVGDSAGTRDESVLFAEVEPFSLDPAFDYDNVQLTPRHFPWSSTSHASAQQAGQNL